MRRFLTILMAICSIGFVTGITGCKKETAGEKLDGAIKATGEAAQDAGDAVKEATDEATE